MKCRICFGLGEVMVREPGEVPRQHPCGACSPDIVVTGRWACRDCGGTGREFYDCVVTMNREERACLECFGTGERTAAKDDGMVDVQTDTGWAAGFQGDIR